MYLEVTIFYENSDYCLCSSPFVVWAFMIFFPVLFFSPKCFFITVSSQLWFALASRGRHSVSGSNHLGCPYHTPVSAVESCSIHGPSLLLMQTMEVRRKTTRDGSTEFLPPVRPGLSSWLWIWTWPCPSSFKHLGNEPVDVIFHLSVSVFLFLCLSK